MFSKYPTGPTATLASASVSVLTQNADPQMQFAFPAYYAPVQMAALWCSAACPRPSNHRRARSNSTRRPAPAIHASARPCATPLPRHRFPNPTPLPRPSLLTPSSHRSQSSAPNHPGQHPTQCTPASPTFTVPPISHLDDQVLTSPSARPAGHPLHPCPPPRQRQS